MADGPTARYTVVPYPREKWAVVDRDTERVWVYRAWLSACRQAESLNTKPHDQRKRVSPCVTTKRKPPKRQRHLIST